MKREARSAVKVDSEFVSQMQALCPGRLDVEEFISAFTEKAILHWLGLLNLLPNMAKPIGTPRRWADAETCLKIYGLTRGQLNHLSAEGEIRKAKTSDAIHSGAVYRCADIKEFLEERASPLHRRRFAKV